MGARSYDPSTGRFASADPVAQPATDQAVSTYSYTNGRPTVLTDPTGGDPTGRDQVEVVRATRDRIVSDMTQAVAIFKHAGGDVRKVATETYTKVSRRTGRAPHAAKTTRGRKAKRAVRRSTARGRKAKA